MTLKEFGIKLMQIRTEKTDLSAYELSLKIGKDASYIHKVENGKVNISLKAILAISEALEISPKDLFN